MFSNGIPLKRSWIRSFPFAALAVVSTGAVTVNAQETSEGITYGEYSDVSDNALRDETVAIRPMVGVISFEDASGVGRSRGAFGTMLDADAFKLLDLDKSSVGGDRVTIGPSIGLIFSHIGAADSNFLGFDSVLPDDLGGNLFIVPLNVKAGYMMTDDLRLGGHIGTNFVYRSVASTMRLTDDPQTNDSSATFYPNIGADLDLAITRSLAITVRPDLTLTPGADIFTGTVALTIPLSTLTAQRG